MITDIFVPLLTYPDADTTSVIDVAMRLTQPFASNLEFCTFEVDIPVIAYSMGLEVIDVSSLIAEAEKRSHASAKHLESHVQALGGAISVAMTSTRMAEAQIPYAATAMARLRDMSIVQLPPNAIGQRRLAEALIFGSGRPVLVVPDVADTSWSSEHVAVSWDGSQVATRAVHDAMDLLVRAKTVTLLTALDDKKLEDGVVVGLISYLDRHGVKASHSDVHSYGIPIGKALQTSALDHGAGMLVIGAFGHSRIREFVLGGATRSVLDQPLLPVLLSH